jgi:hypothetical protein
VNVVFFISSITLMFFAINYSVVAHLTEDEGTVYTCYVMSAILIVLSMLCVLGMT